MYKRKHGGTESAKVITVIETVAVRGKGTKEDPVRFITQYWDFEGNLLAERDYQDDDSWEES